MAPLMSAGEDIQNLVDSLPISAMVSLEHQVLKNYVEMANLVQELEALSLLATVLLNVAKNLEKRNSQKYDAQSKLPAFLLVSQLDVLRYQQADELLIGYSGHLKYNNADAILFDLSVKFRVLDI